jgi:bifunctional non-homologous end joining protein LigD
VLRREAFDDPDFLFELKYDGWRALAYLEDRHCELVSRKGNALKSFESLRATLACLGHNAVLDGEIVSLDASGKPQFYELFNSPLYKEYYEIKSITREQQ